MTSQADSTLSKMTEGDGVRTPIQPRARSRSQSRVLDSMPSRWRAIQTPKKRSRSFSTSPRQDGMGSPELGTLRLAGEEAPNQAAGEDSQPLVSDSLLPSPQPPSHSENLAAAEPPSQLAAPEPKPALTPLPKRLSVQERLALDRIPNLVVEKQNIHSTDSPLPKQASKPQTTLIEEVPQAQRSQPLMPIPREPPPQKQLNAQIPVAGEDTSQSPLTPLSSHKRPRPQALTPKQNRDSAPVKANEPERKKEIEVVDLLSSDDEVPPPKSEPPKKKRRLVSRKTMSPSKPKVKSYVSDSGSDSESEEDDPIGDPDFKLHPRHTRSKSRQVAEGSGRKKGGREGERSGFEGLLVQTEVKQAESPSQVGELGKRRRGKTGQTIPSEKVGESLRNRGTSGEGESSRLGKRSSPPKISTILREAALLNQGQQLKALAKGTASKEDGLSSDPQEQGRGVPKKSNISRSSSRTKQSLQSSATLNSASTVIESADKKHPIDKSTCKSRTAGNICDLDELRRHNSELLNIQKESRLSKSIRDVLQTTPEAPKIQESRTSNAIEDESHNASKVPRLEQPPGSNRSRQLKRPKKDLIREIMERQVAAPPKKAAHKGKGTGAQKSSPKRKRKAKKPLVEPKDSMVKKRKLTDVYDDFEDDRIEDTSPSSGSWRKALDKIGESSTDSRRGSNKKEGVSDGLAMDEWRYAKGDEYNFGAETKLERESASIVAKVLKGSPINNEKLKVAKKKNDTGTRVPTLGTTQIRDSTTPSSSTSSPSSKRQQLENLPPTFLKPLPDILQITIGPDVFSIHQEILQWHCPVLAEVCRISGGRLPPMMADVEVDVFGLFLYWLNGQAYRLLGKDLLLNSLGKPAYQQRLVKLWILASRLRMPKLQNDAIDMLETRRMSEHHEGQIQTKYFGYVYDNTVKGDGLRRYIIDTCLKSAFSKEIYDAFPKELQEDIFEATLVKLENRDSRKNDEVGIPGTEAYHVVEGNSR